MADVFTKDELQLLTVEQLHRLCDYFGIEYTAKNKKSFLIDAVSAKIDEQFVPEYRTTGHPYDGGNEHVSVRIQRIRDLNLGRRLQ